MFGDAEHHRAIAVADRLAAAERRGAGGDSHVDIAVRCQLHTYSRRPRRAAALSHCDRRLSEQSRPSQSHRRRAGRAECDTDGDESRHVTRVDFPQFPRNFDKNGELD